MYKFLTYAPAAKKLRDGEYEELSLYCFGLLSPLTVKQRWTRKNLTTQVYTHTATPANGRLTVVVATPSGETFSNCVKVEVWIEYAGQPVTETRTFIMDTTARRKPTRLGFINTLGGADYYTFTGARTSEVVADKVLFNRDLPATFTTANRGQSVASVTAYEEYELTSDYETEQAYQWLAGLIASPEVWIAEGTRIIPIIITSKSHPVETDNLIQFKIKYRAASDKIVQNG